MQTECVAHGQNLPETVRQNVGSIVELEKELLRQRSAATCLGDRVTRLVASPAFLAAHALVFAMWAVAGTGGLGLPPFDPYPFHFLATCLAVETTLLTTFVLISQRRQARQEDQWAHLTLQVSLLAEQEATKMLQLLEAIGRHLEVGAVARDKDLAELTRTTPILAIVHELASARDQDPPGRLAERPAA